VDVASVTSLSAAWGRSSERLSMICNSPISGRHDPIRRRHPRFLQCRWAQLIHAGGPSSRSGPPASLTA
jgi:hypothetical protein